MKEDLCSCYIPKLLSVDCLIGYLQFANEYYPVKDLLYSAGIKWMLFHFDEIFGCLRMEISSTATSSTSITTTTTSSASTSTTTSSTQFLLYDLFNGNIDAYDNSNNNNNNHNGNGSGNSTFTKRFVDGIIEMGRVWRSYQSVR